MKTSMKILKGHECPDSFDELAILRDAKFSFCMFNELSDESRKVADQLLLEAGSKSKSYIMNCSYSASLSEVTKCNSIGEGKLQLHDYIMPYLRKPNGEFTTSLIESVVPGFFFKTDTAQGKSDFESILTFMEESLNVEFEKKASFKL